MDQRAESCLWCGAHLDLCSAAWSSAQLSALDPERYVADVATGGSVTIQANDCTGRAFWPSSSGQEHDWLGGRDLVWELAAAARRQAVRVAIEYNALHVERFWELQPQVRIVDVRGKSERVAANRLGLSRPIAPCCPNSPCYRKFAAGQLEEIVGRYDFDELSLAMIYWPAVCYCGSCEERFRHETGESALPRAVDWRDPAWVLFQRKREQWLAEYARMLASIARRANPRAVISLRADALLGGWSAAPSLELFQCADRLSSGGVEGRSALSFTARLLRALSTELPFELRGEGVCPISPERTVIASEERVRCTTAVGALSGGASSSAYAVDGRTAAAPARVATMRRIGRELSSLAPFIGGAPCEDVGIFVDPRSLAGAAGCDRSLVTRGGEPWGALREERRGHGAAARSLDQLLAEAHIPSGLITARDLDKLDRYRVLAVPDFGSLEAREIEAFAWFVREGGCLYASGECAARAEHEPDENGQRERSLLSELFGIAIDPSTGSLGQPGDARGRPDRSAIAPTSCALNFFHPYDTLHPVRSAPAAGLIRPREGSSPEVLATIGAFPAITMNRFGKGRAMYSASPIETWRTDTEQRIVARLFRHLIDRPFTVETDAPRSVEVALWRREDPSRHILHLLNFQHELPNIPVRDLTVRLHLGGVRPGRVRLLPGGRSIDFEPTEDGIELTIPKLETYLLVEIT